MKSKIYQGKINHISVKKIHVGSLKSQSLDIGIDKFPQLLKTSLF